jgi:DNA-binding GntR family transcriptional regulator
MTGNQTPFDVILMNIVTGKIKSRDRLVERDLAPQFGVSRTPIREAIRKLESLGLVRCLRNRGAVVTELSPGDMEALYFVRLPLERMAAKLSFHNFSPDDLEMLKMINRELRLCLKKKDNVGDLIENDRKFHHIIYQATGNPYLIQVINELRLKAYVVAYYAWRNPEHIEVSITEHREIIRALETKSIGQFANLLEHQLITAKAFYLENVE